jgi:hypothetical protein
VATGIQTASERAVIENMLTRKHLQDRNVRQLLEAAEQEWRNYVILYHAKEPRGLRVQLFQLQRAFLIKTLFAAWAERLQRDVATHSERWTNRRKANETYLAACSAAAIRRLVSIDPAQVRTELLEAVTIAVPDNPALSSNPAPLRKRAVRVGIPEAVVTGALHNLAKRAEAEASQENERQQNELRRIVAEVLEP